MGNAPFLYTFAVAVVWFPQKPSPCATGSPSQDIILQNHTRLYGSFLKDV